MNHQRHFEITGNFNSLEEPDPNYDSIEYSPIEKKCENCGYKIETGTMCADCQRLQKENDIEEICSVLCVKYVGIQNDENHNPVSVLFNANDNNTLSLPIENFSLENLVSYLEKYYDEKWYQEKFSVSKMFKEIYKDFNVILENINKKYIPWTGDVAGRLEREKTKQEKIS